MKKEAILEMARTLCKTSCDGKLKAVASSDIDDCYGCPMVQINKLHEFCANQVKNESEKTVVSTKSRLTHGRPIDADALYKTMLTERNRIAEVYGDYDEFVRCFDRYMLSMVTNAPTIFLEKEANDP